jgi:hypothetical protein
MPKKAVEKVEEVSKPEVSKEELKKLAKEALDKGTYSEFVKSVKK